VTAERGSVLIVEDTPDSADFIAELVEREGFHPVICPDARAARTAYQHNRPVAVLLDWVLPDAPGTQLCRELRSQDPVLTIMFVSGRTDETSVARGLDAGADDYVTKPVRGGELIARLEAHLRRVALLRAGPDDDASSAHQRRFRFGDLHLDLDSRQVSIGGRRIRLGALEFKLLEYLSLNAGVAVSRDQILAEVYGINADIGTERVDLLVRRLRLKLGQYPDTGGHIIAHPGYGYMLDRSGSGS
jgi:DNA-binding response OmpR family regulator